MVDLLLLKKLLIKRKLKMTTGKVWTLSLDLKDAYCHSETIAGACRRLVEANNRRSLADAGSPQDGQVPDGGQAGKQDNSVMPFGLRIPPQILVMLISSVLTRQTSSKLQCWLISKIF